MPFLREEHQTKYGSHNERADEGEFQFEARKWPALPPPFPRVPDALHPCPSPPTLLQLSLQTETEYSTKGQNIF